MPCRALVEVLKVWPAKRPEGCLVEQPACFLLDLAGSSPCKGLTWFTAATRPGMQDALRVLTDESGGYAPGRSTSWRLFRLLRLPHSTSIPDGRWNGNMAAAWCRELARLGNPAIDRFGLTVRPDGTQYVWLAGTDEHWRSQGRGGPGARRWARRATSRSWPSVVQPASARCRLSKDRPSTPAGAQLNAIGACRRERERGRRCCAARRPRHRPPGGALREPPAPHPPPGR